MKSHEHELHGNLDVILKTCLWIVCVEVSKYRRCC